MKILVTNGRKNRESDQKLALEVSEKLGIEFRPRFDDSLTKIFDSSGIEEILSF